MSSQSNQANQVSSTLTESGEITIHIDGEEKTLPKDKAKSLKKSLSTSLTKAKTAPGIISVGKVDDHYRFDEHPYHIHGEYGCRHSTNAVHRRHDLNLVTLTKLPKQKEVERITKAGFTRRKHKELHYRKEPADEKQISINRFINTFFCKSCEKAVKHWHTQRKHFLPILANSLSIETVSKSTFTEHDSHKGECQTCGTPESAKYELYDGEMKNTGISSPFLLCPTCVTMLSDATDASDLPSEPLDQHQSYRVDDVEPQPITDPNNNLKKESSTSKENKYTDLSKEEFITLIGSFDKCSEEIGEKLYRNDITSLKEINELNQDQLIEIPYIGYGISDKLLERAETLLDK